MYSKGFEASGKLEDTDTFATIGATIADNFQVNMPADTIGESILNDLK
jgi:phosphopentomutase